MPEETEGQEPEVKTYDEDYVRSLRSEAAKHRTEKNELRKQVEELDAEVKGFKDASKSEMERIVEEKAKLERDLADRDREMAEAAVKAQVFAEAAKLNIVDPDMAYLALDLSEIDTEDVKSVSKALVNLVKEKPYLLKSEPPTPGAGGPPLQGKKSPSDMWVDVLKQGLKKQ
jgi:predicted RNase H-like nuclease (RuvC/YqgF family)